MDITELGARRRRRIAIADAAMRTGDRLLFEASGAGGESAKAGRARKAAKLFSRAARQYSRAGISWMSRFAWQRAAGAYMIAGGDTTMCDQALSNSYEVEIHWEF